ncbi:hypothetical protein AO398_00390 [Methylobacterium sp. GXS13]|uniref:hypothetical protein n=1 Tax=Methylobacterium sp. GXS13 TaxID=1730094 RepID=UPI00071BC35B|nr:hypothetical protein [Methylobacterium sp. GXS13]KST61183.1 hypothetical protein AO398_00390 [Methylobacterium sp. GXS13]
MPPIDFGATWRHVGTHRRYDVKRELWLCPDAPPSFSDAYRGARSEMITAGYSWTDRGTANGVLTPCWWGGGDPVDADALAAAIAPAIGKAASDRAERARLEEERIQAETARLAPLAAPIRADLAVIVAERPWMLGRHLTAARELLDLDSWSVWGMQDAERHVRNARGNAERAAERLGRTPPAVWFAKAADEGIRAAACDACQHLSSLDEDWASDRNSIGWSQATCWTGHLLSERTKLDQGEAAHALALLHGHRKQLPDPLCLILFGELPSRRRRSAPADAPTLAL